MTATSETTRGVPGLAGPALRAEVERTIDSFLTARRDMDTTPEWRDGVDALRALALAGGKRTRPTFCCLGWRAFGGGDHPGIVVAATALELFHLFALVHDDIMDDSDVRRGNPTLHVTMAEAHRRLGWRGNPEHYGRNTAILWGDLCLAWSDEAFHGCGLAPERVSAAAGLLHRMRVEVLLGQYLDIRGEAVRADLTDCLTILLYKSAKYTVERPLQIGAMLAGAARPDVERLSGFGVPIGEAFQLRDDVLGVFGDDAVTGKSILTDLRSGKSTVLMALTRERANATQAAEISRWHGNPGLGEREAQRLRHIVRDTGALRTVEEMIHARTQEAVAVLDSLPIVGEVRVALTELAHTLSVRRS
ncbi:geranylgeranyl diphosphate synthase, type I [Micromonospora matsumotoense]|uniref:Geranylgeranyl diphosphate synthase, type I n=1 Tax=Micromonospora matsumotoense TaxID=121616 RepID=A0A1C4Z4A6_9ACTN|nr:polyprenyl synthetase family protein [Micromonospora matsumotoense]SCF27815.1 geranylgeranyl diphosphate synthase, type I [Micromonospora matsumotoense]